MPVYLHPYRSDLIEKLKDIAATKNQYAVSQVQENNGSSNSANTEVKLPVTFSISIDLIPLCKKSTDLSQFDVLEDMITGDTREISISLHYAQSNRADKYIIRMHGVERPLQFANEKDLSGFTGSIDVEKIKNEAAEQTRKAILAEQQAQENEKLRLEIERMKQEPPSEDSIQLNKLIMTAGMAAIKKWETGSLFGNEKVAPASTNEPSGQQKHLLTIGKWFCKRFPQEQHFNAMIELVNLLSRHPELIAIMHDLAAEAQHKSSDAQNEEQEEDDAEEDNQDDQDVIDLTDQTPSNI